MESFTLSSETGKLGCIGSAMRSVCQQTVWIIEDAGQYSLVGTR